MLRQNDSVLLLLPKAAVKTNFLLDSEDEFDDWVKDAPKRKAVISDDESFAPEASDVDVLSPPPKASKPA